MNSSTSDPSTLPSAGPPVHASDFATTVAAADLIIAAAVTKVSDVDGPVSLVSADAGPDADRLRRADAAVVRTLAGAPAQSTVGVLFLEGKLPSRPWAGLAEGQTVLLFLRSTDQGYVPVEPTQLLIQTLPGIAPPPAGASRAEAVIHELEQIILTADPESAAGLITQAAIARSTLRGDADVRLLDAPPLQHPVRRMAWVAVTLADGRLEALSEVEPLLAARATDATAPLGNLITQKVSEIKAAEARPQLAALLRGASVELARAAAVALRQLHDPAATPDLIEALNHADQEVRYQSVMGLAELEPGVGAGPSYELYRSDEPGYIRRWKQWWEASGRS